MTLTFPSQSNISTQSNSDFKLKDILKTLPKECFQKNPRKAWMTVFTNVVMVVLGYAAIAVSPWYLLPIAWFFTGTALTGFFVIGHDCGHRSFAKRRWVNDWVGHLFMMPLIYPFHSWRILHNHHHAHTNKMDEDNAWQPFRPEVFGSFSLPLRLGYEYMRGGFWWLASIVHWAGLHFDLSQFETKDHPKVKQSIAVVVIFAAIVFPLLISNLGLWGFVKFWLLPWLGYHFWMSTFTLVHHTDPRIAFSEPADWNEAQAQLAGTVHCDYPGWVEFLCHHINVHIPHHISTAIPAYNLRMAHASLKQNWGEYLTESQFSWSLMKEIITECHLYDDRGGYLTFQEFYRSR